MKIGNIHDAPEFISVDDMEEGEVYQNVANGDFYMKTDESDWPLLNLGSGMLICEPDTDEFIHFPNAKLAV